MKNKVWDSFWWLFYWLYAIGFVLFFPKPNKEIVAYAVWFAVILVLLSRGIILILAMVYYRFINFKNKILATLFWLIAAYISLDVVIAIFYSSMTASLIAFIGDQKPFKNEYLYAFLIPFVLAFLITSIFKKGKWLEI